MPGSTCKHGRARASGPAGEERAVRHANSHDNGKEGPSGTGGGRWDLMLLGLGHEDLAEFGHMELQGDW